MTRLRSSAIRLLFVTSLLGYCGEAVAGENEHHGFIDHGVASPMSMPRGIVATADAAGRDCVLVWLCDHRGGYALLMIDAETGEAVEHPTPFDYRHDTPFASLLASNGCYYTLFGGHFAEFSPVERQFTFHQATHSGTAMSLAEGPHGDIWAATFPDCGVVRFDPQARELRDFGHVYQQDWRRYPRSLAVADNGWAYVGLGETASQILAVNPESGAAAPLLDESERRHGQAVVFRGDDVGIYGAAATNDGPWWKLDEASRTPLSHAPESPPVEQVAGNQTLFHREFPSGDRLISCDLIARQLQVATKSGDTRAPVSFDYTSEGAHIMAVAAASDGRVVGGTAFPMRGFRYSPNDDTWENDHAYGQWNALRSTSDALLVAGYPGGFLLAYDSSRTWVNTTKDNASANPTFLAEATPTIHRPHDVLACQDENLVIMAGTPDYGLTGGGLLFYDRTTGEHEVVEHLALVPDQATMSLANTADGMVLGGTTTAPGTGGQRKATLAELYLLDPATRKLVWHAPLVADAQVYLDLCPAANGAIYGIVGTDTLIVFDPTERKLVYQHQLGDLAPTAGAQGPRILVPGDGRVVYLLLSNGIARIDPDTYQVTRIATAPAQITSGGAYANGRLYFACGSHLWSYAVTRP